MLSAGKTPHTWPAATPAQPSPARTRHKTINRSLIITISQCYFSIFWIPLIHYAKESLEQNAGQEQGFSAFADSEGIKTWQNPKSL
jgi:hypothetical protein